MKRRAFILTEILTGMMLQVMFAVILCSAFYLILNFSTSAQQGFAANDKGQMVIAYFDSRIRNAGLGLWGCHGSKDIRLALNEIPALQEEQKDSENKKNLCLPVAIVRSDDKGKGTISRDTKTKVYSGNVVTLLYAHKDPNEVRLILTTSDNRAKKIEKDTEYFPTKSTSNDFFLIDKKTEQLKSYTASNFAKGVTEGQSNIKKYAVIEGTGIPIYIASNGTDAVRLSVPSAIESTKIYPMSELLNLECQKLYVRKDDNGYNFVFHELGSDGKWDKFYYHTKDILDLYMTLDTKPAIPIFELRVLVSEGINEQGTTTKPKDWPGRWKDKDIDFSIYKVHVSKATWKLYNLAPMFN